MFPVDKTIEREGKTMKKLVSLLLVLVMLAASSALALNYKATLGNEATFETYTEVRENALAAMAEFNAAYVPHPVMADYPGDTTYIYRSPDMYGITAAVRLNQNIVVYADEFFEDKAAAKAYLDEMGLCDIADTFRGSVILVTPSVPYGEDSSGNKSGGFTESDQKYYYALQTAMFAINASVAGGTAVDASYYGGYGFYYLIGINGGATFLNNFVVGTLDYCSRIAGLLLVNGEMERISSVAAPVPTYLINADDATIAKYREANGADAFERANGVTTWYNQFFPVRKVVVKDGDFALSDVSDIYYDFLIKAQRSQQLKSGLNSASTPYKGYTNDCAPYALSKRNAVINGRTVDGINMIDMHGDEFKAYMNESTGEYIDTWWEYVPDEVLDNTAAPGTIPLLLAIHGGGDDARQYVDNQGWLNVAGEERIAIIAPDYTDMNNFSDEGRATLMQAFPALVHYMLEKYPALDASRVYVNGYSMGALGTTQAMYGDPSTFAAAFPQAGAMNTRPREEQFETFKTVKLPICGSTSEYDLYVNVDTVTHNLVEGFYGFVYDIVKLNEVGEIPEVGDFDTYPMVGFDADIVGSKVINGEYTDHYWYFVDDNGVPMVGFHYFDGAVHNLYPEYARVCWDFFKHYSRNQETGEIEYNPYVD